MKFKEISIDQAESTILAHSLKLPDRKLKKGIILSKEDIVDIKNNNYLSIMVAIPAAEDVSEDIAARELASFIAGEGVVIEKSVSGRCNLRAKTDGLFLIDKEFMDKINLVHESLTVATLEPFINVYQGQLIATVKIIPYAVSQENLQSCLAIIKEAENNVLRIATFQPKSIAFIQTRVTGSRESVLDKTTKVFTQRLRRLNSFISIEVRCQHDKIEVENVVTQVQEHDVDLIVISGASAVADRGDVVPSAIVSCGGEIIHFGMPVDPGNLLLIASCNGKYVLGMPGCARSPKLNGFDKVLDRLVADIPVTSRDIMLMGVGGLLKEIADRPQPRVVRSDTENMKKINKVSAIVLAAGQSRRMGAINKLLVEINGHSMIEQVVNNLSKSNLDEIIVVTGFEAEKIKSALKAFDLKYVNNSDYENGLSTSLAAGLRSVKTTSDAVIICLGDMPMVTSSGINQLCEDFNTDAGREICVPTYQGKRGNPVLWSSGFIHEMLQTEGDVGAKHLLFKYNEVVHEVAMADSGVLLDFDTQQEVKDYQKKKE